MNFETVLKMLLESFQKANVDTALIGGFALQASGIVRATKDIDFLVAEEDMPRVKTIMISFGYDILHESQDVCNFAGKMKELGRVDFLLAHRKYARVMLECAKAKEVLQGKFKVKIIRTEDLIGLKVQSSSNDPSRYNLDMSDIESLIRLHHKDLDLNLIKEYFSLFNREKELEDILKKIRHAH